MSITNNPYYQPAAASAVNGSGLTLVTPSSGGGGGGGGALALALAPAGRGLAGEPNRATPGSPSRGIHWHDRWDIPPSIPRAALSPTTFPIQGQLPSQAGMGRVPAPRAAATSGAPAPGSAQWQMEIDTFVDDLVNMELARRDAATSGRRNLSDDGGELGGHGGESGGGPRFNEDPRFTPTRTSERLGADGLVRSPGDPMLQLAPAEYVRSNNDGRAAEGGGGSAGGGRYRAPVVQFNTAYSNVGPRGTLGGGQWGAVNTPVVNHVRNLAQQFNTPAAPL